MNNCIKEKRFKIAFSFPGEVRNLVEQIAKGVAKDFPKEQILYDQFHMAEFAKPNLDHHLQNLYRTESELIVVFLSSYYQEKTWCGIEWRAIRDMINRKQDDVDILLVKCDDGKVDGVYESIDGYIDAAKVSVETIVNAVLERHCLMKQKDKENCTEKTPSFSFELDINGKLENISVPVKNKIRKWYLEDRNQEFMIEVHDGRISELLKQRLLMDQKIEQNEDFSDIEEFQYMLLTKAMKKCERECLLKKYALTFFLKDQLIQGYFLIITPVQLMDYMMRILNYDYYAQQQFCHKDFMTLDIFLNPSPKEYYDHFVTHLEKSKVKEAMGGIGLYDLFGAYVADLGSDIVREVAVDYYFFLAEQALTHDNQKFTENKKIMNLLNYFIGLH